jgi:alkanesulfonate monooxygenase SsuD/methylene tetrahydromethanopterin reductase-like flavin-dependent oxidoreductase (luciferase family)
MKFGLFGGARSAGEGAVGDSLGYRKYIDYVLAAEALGYHSVFVVEHHFTGVGQLSASLNFLSYLAAKTRRIRLGTAVIVLPWHNPALLAEQVATLDLLSEGRFDLGVGKGYRETEFSGFSIPIGEATERFDETLAFLRKAWSSPDRFSHHGKRWRFENIVIEPRPAQQPHPPLWMGAGSFESIRRAAREDFNLLLDQVATIDLTIERVAAYKDELARHGRPWRPQRIGVARALQIVRSEAEREAALALRTKVLRAIGGLARGPGAERYHNIGSHADPGLASEESALLGTPEEIVARLKKLEAGGADYVLLVDPTGSVEALHTFAAEIMPALADVA